VDDRDELRRGLDTLTRRQRAAVVLRYFDDLSEAEVAAILGCSVGTVKSQTSRALAKFRLVLAPSAREGQPGMQPERALVRAATGYAQLGRRIEARGVLFVVLP
jgi:DNA-binding CsgD family transcriptional regulator